jgi:hypothetical protein
MPLRPQFREALELLAAATESLIAKGYAPPILVGGAAVEIYTGGAVTSGDFDFVSPWRDEFFAELRAVGFKAPDRPGWLKWALLHPDLDFGVQVVSKPLMDGKADTNRIMLVDLTAEDAAKSLKLFLISVEDLIADRVSQALAGRNIEESMQNQAIMLYRLTETLDRTYLDRRIGEETGNDASLQMLEDWTKDATDLA